MSVPVTEGVPAVTLHDGTTIPQLGFGVFQVPAAETEATVLAALEVGYRHVDTAQMYGNEAGVGAAVRASGLPREELYVTTKLSNGSHRPDDVRRAFDGSLTELGLDRVDLFLIHWPLPARYDGDYVSTWRAVTELMEDGRLTSAGVSNFQPHHLERIIGETGVVPVVNQVEVHPFFGNEAVRAANAARGIATEAWSPIARGKVTADATIRDVADRLGRTPTQVTLRWHVQRGDVVIPKTASVDRMRENFAALDFELAPDDMALVTGLDRGESGRMGAHPDTMNSV